MTGQEAAAPIPRVHRPLEECVREARLLAFGPPPLVPGKGGVLRPPTPAEARTLRAEAVGRAEAYARWRVAAYLDGSCAHSF